jgi:signal transduction histidine kinase
MNPPRSRVLVAEDSATQAEQVRILLEADGYEVQLAANGARALEAVRTAAPDLILSDIVMPEMDGYTFCSTLKATDATRPIPFVMMTALQVGDEKIRALDAGADDLLQKPVDREELLARVRSLLRSKMLYDDLQRANASLQQLTAELEDRVAERTARLQESNEQLATMSQQLWQTAKLATMGELAASIAHEINNPLAIVTLRVESLMAQVTESDPTWRSLEVIASELERMAHLVANLLQSSRKTTQQISSVDLAKELDATMELVRSYVRNRQVMIVQEIAPDVPLVPADRQHLRQVFLNLITNAADAMSDGGTLTIRVSRGEKNVVLEFGDTGQGIPPDVLPRVREAFFTTKGEGRGTGLGLAICQRIVQQHHGVLDISSTVGKGTTIRIELPLTNGHNAAHVLGIDPESTELLSL